MKINKTSYFFLSSFLVLLAACSTKRDKWANRNFQALNTKYNVLYNGNIALTDGVNDLKSQYKDNFWDILPVERMQVSADKMLPGESKNKNFERAEEKATKAIQKRSMLIDGKEKNSQTDEAYLLLGKARYYDQRFIPALEAFNYILYKNPESDKIYEAKIWCEKTNMRLDNDELALKNLKRLLAEIKFKDQVFADANATIAQAYLNLGEKDKAVPHLKKAILFTKLNEEKARYHYIVGQLYSDLGKKDSAFAAYQSVIDMKRKSPRVYIIHAQGEQSRQFDSKKGDTLVFTKKYKALMKDRENRPFMDVLNYQLASYYDQKNSDAAAKKYYNLSLKSKPTDKYLIASDYRNLAKIHFDNAKYVLAGKYYDSTLVNLEPRTREYNYIKRKRENLDDVIKYEGIAQKNDSILNILALSDADRGKYFESYISKIKKEDEKKATLKKAADEKAKAAAYDDSGSNDMPSGMSPPSASGMTPPTPGQENTFYFYTASTVAFGKLEFQKKWGNRPRKENWRMSSAPATATESVETTADETAAKEGAVAEELGKDKAKETKPEYSTDFYTSKLPTDKKEIETLAKDRDFAYYQLGLIYKEKFTEYQLAADKLERLLTYKPEERLVLPSMYHLYKIYEIINKEKALAMKNKIIEQYPDSRYASILSNKNSGGDLLAGSPEVAYNNLFKVYEKGDYFKVLEESTVAIDQFTGEEIVPKYELLKASTIGKLKGLGEYKNALNFVALNYPNSPEGKEAEALVSKNIPALEALNFGKKESRNWNILYEVNDPNSPKTKVMEEKLKKFAAGRTVEKLTYSLDIYTMTEYLAVIHGIPSEEEAKGIVTILADYKDYKIEAPAIIITSENYAVVQIKKNLKDYQDFIKPAPVPEKTVPAVQNNSIPVQNNAVPQNAPGKAVAPAVVPSPTKPMPNQQKTTTPTQPTNLAPSTVAPNKVQPKPVSSTVAPVTPNQLPSQQKAPATAPQTAAPAQTVTPAPVQQKVPATAVPQTTVPNQTGTPAPLDKKKP